MFELFESRGLMCFQYSIIDFRSTDTHMQGTMHAARVAPHLNWRATLQHNPPRGQNAGGASAVGSTIEPYELPPRNPRPMSRPELCVGRRTGIEREEGPRMVRSNRTRGKFHAVVEMPTSVMNVCI